jgi:putative peptide zinc metalloprotease protein
MTLNAEKKQETIFEPLRNDLQLFENKNSDLNSKSWMLFDPVADKYYRIGEKEHFILSFLSKPFTINSIFQNAKAVNDKITLSDINAVISFLFSSNLLLPAFGSTESRVKQIKLLKEKNRLNVLLSSYLFFRIPLWKPDKFLSDTLETVETLFNKYLLTILFFLALCGYFLLITHWQKFEITMIDSLNYAGMIKYGITVIFLKVLHEFAHAYTAKSAGVRVRRFGIGFIVFFPRFFTDITDSWRINDKKKKILIDGAGILTELLIGGIAVIFWIYSGPGIIKTIAYYVFAVSIINTVLINGNPFIRYDGYYILMDFINIDNLQQRSKLLISQAFREKLFGIKTNVPFSYTGLKKNLIIIYGISSFIYRFFLYTGIILIVYYKFTKFIGIILAILEVYVLVLRPFYKETQGIMKSIKKTDRKKLIITSLGTIFILFIFLVPLPWTISLPCITGSSRDNIIYIQSQGFLKKIAKKNNSRVKKGETLFILDNPQLLKEKDILLKNLNIKNIELDQLNSTSDKNRLESRNTKIQQIEHIKNSIKENQRKIDLLKIKSPIEGTFVIFNWNMKSGKWLNFGEPVGEVFSPDNILIYAYAKEKSADSFKLTQQVNIFLNDNIKKFKGEITRINPVPTKEWHPSPLLSSSNGPLPILKKEGINSYILKDYYYQITIKPLKQYRELKFSRTGSVQAREYTSIGINFIRTVISTIQRELAF